MLQEILCKHQCGENTHLKCISKQVNKPLTPAATHVPVKNHERAQNQHKDERPGNSSTYRPVSERHSLKRELHSLPSYLFCGWWMAIENQLSARLFNLTATPAQHKRPMLWTLLLCSEPVCVRGGAHVCILMWKTEINPSITRMLFLTRWSPRTAKISMCVRVQASVGMCTVHICQSLHRCQTNMLRVSVCVWWILKKKI